MVSFGGSLPSGGSGEPSPSGSSVVLLLGGPVGVGLLEDDVVGVVVGDVVVVVVV